MQSVAAASRPRAVNAGNFFFLSFLFPCRSPTQQPAHPAAMATIPRALLPGMTPDLMQFVASVSLSSTEPDCHDTALDPPGSAYAADRQSVQRPIVLHEGCDATSALPGLPSYLMQFASRVSSTPEQHASAPVLGEHKSTSVACALGASVLSSSLPGLSPELMYLVAVVTTPVQAIAPPDPAPESKRIRTGEIFVLPGMQPELMYLAAGVRDPLFPASSAVVGESPAATSLPVPPVHRHLSFGVVVADAGEPATALADSSSTNPTVTVASVVSQTSAALSSEYARAGTSCAQDNGQGSAGSVCVFIFLLSFFPRYSCAFY